MRRETIYAKSKISLLKKIDSPDYVVDVGASTLAQTQNPSTWIGFQLEVTQIRHNDGVYNDGFALCTESYLKAPWGAASVLLETVTL